MGYIYIPYLFNWKTVEQIIEQFPEFKFDLQPLSERSNFFDIVISKTDTMDSIILRNFLKLPSVYPIFGPSGIVTISPRHIYRDIFSMSQEKTKPISRLRKESKYLAYDFSFLRYKWCGLIVIPEKDITSVDEEVSSVLEKKSDSKLFRSILTDILWFKSSLHFYNDKYEISIDDSPSKEIEVFVTNYFVEQKPEYNTSSRNWKDELMAILLFEIAQSKFHVGVNIKFIRNPKLFLKQIPKLESKITKEYEIYFSKLFNNCQHKQITRYITKNNFISVIKKLQNGGFLNTIKGEKRMINCKICGGPLFCSHLYEIFSSDDLNSILMKYGVFQSDKFTCSICGQIILLIFSDMEVINPNLSNTELRKSVFSEIVYLVKNNYKFTKYVREEEFLFTTTDVCLNLISSTENLSWQEIVYAYIHKLSLIGDLEPIRKIHDITTLISFRHNINQDDLIMSFPKAIKYVSKFITKLKKDNEILDFINNIIFGSNIYGAALTTLIADKTKYNNVTEIFKIIMGDDPKTLLKKLKKKEIKNIYQNLYKYEKNFLFSTLWSLSTGNIDEHKDDIAIENNRLKTDGNFSKITTFALLPSTPITKLFSTEEIKLSEIYDENGVMHRWKYDGTIYKCQTCGKTKLDTGKISDADIKEVILSKELIEEYSEMFNYLCPVTNNIHVGDPCVNCGKIKNQLYTYEQAKSISESIKPEKEILEKSTTIEKQPIKIHIERSILLDKVNKISNIINIDSCILWAIGSTENPDPEKCLSVMRAKSRLIEFISMYEIFRNFKNIAPNNGKLYVETLKIMEKNKLNKFEEYKKFPVVDYKLVSTIDDYDNKNLKILDGIFSTFLKLYEIDHPDLNIFIKEDLNYLIHQDFLLTPGVPDNYIRIYGPPSNDYEKNLDIVGDEFYTKKDVFSLENVDYQWDSNVE